jgi:hypothetical protein
MADTTDNLAEGKDEPSRYVAVQVQLPDGEFVMVHIAREEAEREGLLEYLTAGTKEVRGGR